MKDKDIQQASEWFAGEVGIDFSLTEVGLGWRLPTTNESVFYDFTIKDAKVRSLIWEWYIDKHDEPTHVLELNKGRDGLFYAEISVQGEWILSGKGKSIEEAEIKCLIQIADKMRGE